MKRASEKAEKEKAAEKEAKEAEKEAKKLQRHWCELRDKCERTPSEEAEKNRLENELEKIADEVPDTFLERSKDNSLTAGHAASMRKRLCKE